MAKNSNHRSGPIDTAIVRNGEAKGLWNQKMLGDETLLGRTGWAEEVAKVICFLLSEDASFVTGGQYQDLNFPKYIILMGF